MPISCTRVRIKNSKRRSLTPDNPLNQTDGFILIDRDILACVSQKRIAGLISKSLHTLRYLAAFRSKQDRIDDHLKIPPLLAINHIFRENSCIRSVLAELNRSRKTQQQILDIGYLSGQDSNLLSKVFGIRLTRSNIRVRRQRNSVSPRLLKQLPLLYLIQQYPSKRCRLLLGRSLTRDLEC